MLARSAIKGSAVTPAKLVAKPRAAKLVVRAMGSECGTVRILGISGSLRKASTNTGEHVTRRACLQSHVVHERTCQFTCQAAQTYMTATFSSFLQFYSLKPLNCMVLIKAPSNSPTSYLVTAPQFQVVTLHRNKLNHPCQTCT